MPRAPTYQPQIDRITPSAERLRAVDDGGGIAGGIARGLQVAGRAGSQAIEAQDQINAHHDRIATRAKALEYRAKASALKMEFSALEGEDALYSAPEYDQRLKALGDEYRGSVTTQRQKQFLSEQIDPFEAQTGLELSGHLMGAQKKLHETTLQAELGEAAQNAMGSVSNPEALSGYMGDVDSILAEQADLYGWSPEIKQSMTRQAKSGIHSGVIGGMLSTPDPDLDLVVAYFGANEDEMTAADRNAVMKSIQGPLETRMAHTDFMEIASGTAPGVTEEDAEPATATSAPNLMPVEGARTTDNFSAHSRRGSAGHDFAAPPGTSIKLPADGVVEEVGTGKTGGNFVRIRHADGTLTSYMHMQHPSKLSKGDSVTRSTVIGTVGSTGRTSGPHLHMEVKDASGKQVDPLAWLNGSSPTGAPNDPRDWDAGSIRADIDAKVASGDWSFERGERAWAYASTRMSRDEAIIGQREGDAYEAAQEWLIEHGLTEFTDTSQMPEEVRSALSPAARLTFERMALSNKEAKQGSSVKANGPTALMLTQQSVLNPTAFANMDISEMRPLMTGAEFEGFVKKQIETRQKGEEWTPHSGVSSAFNRMRAIDGSKYSDADKAGILTLMMENAYDQRRTNGGKPLTDDDYNRAYRFALGEVTTRSTFGPFANTYEQPRYKADDRVERARERVETVEQTRAARAEARRAERVDRVRKTFREAYGRNPDAAEVEYWLTMTP